MGALFEISNLFYWIYLGFVMEMRSGQETNFDRVVYENIKNYWGIMSMIISLNNKKIHYCCGRIVTFVIGCFIFMSPKGARVYVA